MSSGEFWLIRERAEIKTRVKAFQEYLEQRWDWSKPVTWQTKVYRRKRSLNQNDLFHKWVRELHQHFTTQGAFEGTEQEIKLMLKHKFLGCEDVVITLAVDDVVREVVRNQVRQTSRLDRGEMMMFMERVEAWASDLGVMLTKPVDSEYFKNQQGQT